MFQYIVGFVILGFYFIYLVAFAAHRDEVDAEKLKLKQGVRK